MSSCKCSVICPSKEFIDINELIRMDVASGTSRRPIGSSGADIQEQVVEIVSSSDDEGLHNPRPSVTEETARMQERPPAEEGNAHIDNDVTPAPTSPEKTQRSNRRLVTDFTKTRCGMTMDTFRPVNTEQAEQYSTILKEHFWPNENTDHINMEHVLCDFVSVRVLLSRCDSGSMRQPGIEVIPEDEGNLRDLLWPNVDPNSIDVRREIIKWQNCVVRLDKHIPVAANQMEENSNETDQEFDTSLPHQNIIVKRVKRRRKGIKRPYEKIAKRPEVLKMKIIKKMNKYSDNDFDCPLCDKRYKEKKSLNFHFKGKHQAVTRFSCNYCSRRFLHKGELEAHVLRHERTKDFKCNKCGQRFFTIGSVNFHKKTCGKRTKYTCDICQTVLSSKGALKQHIIHELSNRSYTCGICGQVMSHPASFYKHKLVCDT